MDIAVACQNHLNYCERERNLGELTLKAYEQDFAELIGYFRDRQLDSIREDCILAYVRHLQATRRLSPATVKRRLACVRAMFARNAKSAIIERDPFSHLDLRIRIPDRLPRYVPAADMRRMLLATDRACPTTRLAALILFATGIRVSELVAIHVSDLSPDCQIIKIFGKGSRERQVFITDKHLSALLRRHVHRRQRNGTPSKALLLNARHEPISAASVRQRIRQLARHAGVDRRVTPHMLRHTAATSLLDAGVDIRMVQRLLGHRTITTTQIYAHVSDQSLQSAIARADVMGRLTRGRRRDDGR